MRLKCSLASLVIGMMVSSASQGVAQQLEPVTPSPLPAAPAQGAPGDDEVAQIDLLDRLVVRQWVRLETNGSLHGTVVTPEGQGKTREVGGAKVGLVTEGGQVIEGQTEADGTFEFNNVRPGTYGMFVMGEGILASYAIHVLPPKVGRVSQAETRPLRLVAQPVPRSASDLRVAAGPANLDLMRQSVRSYLPGVSGDGGSVASSTRSSPLRRYEEDPVPQRRQSDTFRISLRPDGSLLGRLRFPESVAGGSQGKQLSQLNVVVMDSVEVLGRGEVLPSGRFVVPKLTPGVYSLVVAGKSGFAAVGVELTERKPKTAMRALGMVRLAAYQNVPADGEESDDGEEKDEPLDGDCDGDGDVDQDDEDDCALYLEVNTPEMANPVLKAIGGNGQGAVAGPGAPGFAGGPGGAGAAMGGGGFGGGGAGAGAGAGAGGGGLGGLGALGALAAAAAAAGNGGGGNGFVPPPASPAVP